MILLLLPRQLTRGGKLGEKVARGGASVGVGSRKQDGIVLLSWGRDRGGGERCEGGERGSGEGKHGQNHQQGRRRRRPASQTASKPDDTTRARTRIRRTYHGWIAYGWVEVVVVVSHRGNRYGGGGSSSSVFLSIVVVRVAIIIIIINDSRVAVRRQRSSKQAIKQVSNQSAASLPLSAWHLRHLPWSCQPAATVPFDCVAGSECGAAAQGSARWRRDST